MEKGPINASPAGATATDGEKCCLPTKYVGRINNKDNKDNKKKGGAGGHMTHFEPYLQGECLIFSESWIKSITD